MNEKETALFNELDNTILQLSKLKLVNNESDLGVEIQNLIVRCEIKKVELQGNLIIEKKSIFGRFFKRYVVKTAK
jgi:hypothetical protein